MRHYSLLQEFFSTFHVIFLSGGCFILYYSLPPGFFSVSHVILLLLHYSLVQDIFKCFACHIIIKDLFISFMDTSTNLGLNL